MDIKIESIKKEIKAIYGGDEGFIQIAITANFKCEYCDKNILENEDNFKEWHYDHIVPKNKGGGEELANIAFSCRTCNVNWKGWWYDPREKCKDKSSRIELILACREYIRTRKEEARQNLARIKKIINNTADWHH